VLLPRNFGLRVDPRSSAALAHGGYDREVSYSPKAGVENDHWLSAINLAVDLLAQVFRSLGIGYRLEVSQARWGWCGATHHSPGGFTRPMVGFFSEGFPGSQPVIPKSRMRTAQVRFRGRRPRQRGRLPDHPFSLLGSPALGKLSVSRAAWDNAGRVPPQPVLFCSRRGKAYYYLQFGQIGRFCCPSQCPACRTLVGVTDDL